MLGALIAACLAGTPIPDGTVPAVYVTCEAPLVIVGEAAPEPEPVEPEPEAEPPERVWLGIDCNPGVDAHGDEVAYAVSLPDDVLTECEDE